MPDMEFDAETARLLLKNKYDRIENMVKSNDQATLAIPTALGAIWGLSVNYNGLSVIPFLCAISFILLLIWRYIAHYIDDSIVGVYIQIIKIENSLKVPIKISLYYNLVEGLFKDKKINSNNHPNFNDLLVLCADQRVKFFEILKSNNKMGQRGHDIFDNIALFLIFICLYVFLITTLNLEIALLIFLFVFTIIVTFFIGCFIKTWKNYHQKLKDEDIKFAYDEAKKYVPITIQEC